MKGFNFNVRGIKPEVMALLREEAEKNGTSINRVLLATLEQGIGYTQKPKRMVHHDLDALAGSWSSNELSRFEQNIKVFEEIDEELWQ